MSPVFQIKSKLEVLGGKHNWGIDAKCHAVLPCSLELFRRLVAPEATEITPSSYNNLTPVILAQLDGDGAARVFGKTKVQNGTRLGSWYADEMDIVYISSKNELRVWWTMH